MGRYLSARGSSLPIDRPYSTHDFLTYDLPNAEVAYTMLRLYSGRDHKLNKRTDRFCARVTGLPVGLLFSTLRLNPFRNTRTTEYLTIFTSRLLTWSKETL